MTRDDLDTWVSTDHRAHCRRCGGSFPGGYRACPYDATPLDHGDDPLIGALIDGRYRIESFAGEGGIGRVYVARHERLERRYAIKVPGGHAVSDPRGRERFIREARAASRLDHPNVVSVIDFGETDARLLYLVMELADGEDLAEVLARGRLPLADAVSLVRQIAVGLEHAHGRGLIHRDLKPSNVIVERADGRPRILDFGLALLAEGGEERLTSRRTVVGTPHYMSPEHACGLPVDARADLFSLGLIMYQALCGRMPFDASPLDIVQRYLNETAPRFAERVPGLEVDPETERLCRALIEARREARPADAAAVIAALDAVLDRLAAERARTTANERAPAARTVVTRPLRPRVP